MHKIYNTFYIFLFFLLLPLLNKGQNAFHDFGFMKSQVIPVIENNNQLAYPWVGGINTGQFSSTDLNFDGKKDLVVFERNGNKLMCFINTSPPGSYQFEYAPEYEHFFPHANDWFFMKDYDADGLEDIFTYSLAGIRVYKNTSSLSKGLTFIKISERLESLQGSSMPVNIFSSSVEIPAMVDLTGDGCLDVLVFHVLGAYLNMHRNLSMEKFGNCDSLLFERERYCWGNFMETEESNQIEMNIDCPVDQSIEKHDITLDQSKLHAGSSVSPFDINGDGIFDLLIGDVDFSNLVALYNQGNNIDAEIFYVDTAFPSATTPVNVLSMPYPSIIDIDNDGIDEFIVAPFDEKSNLSKNHHHIWLYKSTGDEIPELNLQTTSFLLDDMISMGTCAFPTFANFSSPLAPDLFIGNYGYFDTAVVNNGITTASYIASISWYKNTGTPENPAFELITKDLASLSSLETTHLYPSLADLDNDNDMDLITGMADGSIAFIENISVNPEMPQWATPILQYQNIQTAPFAAPQLFDLNKDGLTDLIIGSRNGKLAYYQNTGSLTIPEFTLITDELGNVNVTNLNYSYYGFSTPHFFLTPQGNTALFTGSNKGQIYYYKNIDNNLEGTFELFDSNLLYIYDGWRSAPAVYNLNNDAYPDMIVGNNRGGLSLYMGKEAPVLSNPEFNSPDHLSLDVFPNPATKMLNIRLNRITDPGDFSISLFNIEGKNVVGNKNYYNISNDCSIAYDIPELSPGIYVLKIIIHDIQIHKKIVIGNNY